MKFFVEDFFNQVLFRFDFLRQLSISFTHIFWKKRKKKKKKMKISFLSSGTNPAKKYLFKYVQNYKIKTTEPHQYAVLVFLLLILNTTFSSIFIVNFNRYIFAEKKHVGKSASVFTV